MIITHNNLNRDLERLMEITEKGQPWAKKHKERMIRYTIRKMIREQEGPITLVEVGFYLWKWIKDNILGFTQIKKHANEEQNRSIFTSRG